eukprot:gnl/Chilomastix_cuspidata/7763.p2 GENE.gnl/Chilomastix_cuspidata/7763~~gnl/Chilomastix_cuspidata/7763.p2  ORF type:complete len:146 (+),score=70.74 gnl/Chilomastix_cuspidata/7763:507-944(+)
MSEFPRPHLGERFLFPEPPLKLRRWVWLVLKRSRLPRVVFVGALAFLRRVLDENRSTYLCQENVFRLFLTCSIIVSKLLLDGSYTARSWAHIVANHYPVSFLNNMEAELLRLINFRSHISEADVLALLQDTYALSPQPSALVPTL